METHHDAPGDSITDQVANAAFDAIEQALREHGQDPDRSYAVVMVLIPGASPLNATVAGHMPDASNTALLEHILSQIDPLARECGVTITARQDQQN